MIPSPLFAAWTALTLAVLDSPPNADAHAGEFGVNVYGLSSLFDSDTYNRDRTFLAPLPIAAYELGPVTLNFVYLPKFRDVNPVAALGFWATFWPGR